MFEKCLKAPFSHFVDSSFILGNARVVDHPIVFANDGFCKITGYNRAEVMQQSSMLRFMWGESTDPETCKKMEEAFNKQEMLQVELLLVKKTSKFKSHHLQHKHQMCWPVIWVEEAKLVYLHCAQCHPISIQSGHCQAHCSMQLWKHATNAFSWPKRCQTCYYRNLNVTVASNC